MPFWIILSQSGIRIMFFSVIGATGWRSGTPHQDKIRRLLCLFVLVTVSMLLGLFFSHPLFFFTASFWWVHSRLVQKNLVHPYCSCCACAQVSACVCVNPVVGSKTGLECVSGPLVNDRLPKSQSTFLLLFLLAFFILSFLSLPSSSISPLTLQ